MKSLRKVRACEGYWLGLGSESCMFVCNYKNYGFLPFPAMSFASGGAASEVKILIVGLNNAGKTTLLYKLALGNIVVTEPTVGSNVESVTHNGVKM